jgi:hypothetical protein
MLSLLTGTLGITGKGAEVGGHNCSGNLKAVWVTIMQPCWLTRTWKGREITDPKWVFWYTQVEANECKKELHTDMGKMEKEMVGYKVGLFA